MSPASWKYRAIGASKNWAFTRYCLPKKAAKKPFSGLMPTVRYICVLSSPNTGKVSAVIAAVMRVMNRPNGPASW
ncbi:Uncharacterised protein [Mycobacteroides abscessus subsp. massiliense]|nr:Uncharacterised protein [Mycobacteroides abscessus subsp. massiliense]